MVSTTLALETPLPITTTRAIPTTSVAHVHRQYAQLEEGKHWNDRVSIDVTVEEVKQTSSRLVFLRVRDAHNNNKQDDDDANNAVNSDHQNSNNNILEVLLRERDSFLSQDDIERLTQAAQQPGARLQCYGFPETMSAFDGRSFFPHLRTVDDDDSDDAASAAAGVCLHVVAANVTTPGGERLEVGSMDETMDETVTVTSMLPGRMPPLLTTKTTKSRPNKKRGGGGNRDRGGIFATWAVETFGLEVLRQQHDQDVHILDVAGGAGQLAFQLGYRRGFNTTVVDPRPQLRLVSDQQRTIQYHIKNGLRVVPRAEESNPSLPASDYGHHFYEVPATGNTDTDPEKPQSTIPTSGDRTWLVGGDAHVRHLSTCFDTDFVQSYFTTSNDDANVWRDCSVVLGMHSDEATEDLVDLALAYDKPFAVVPCCVFWKLDPHRKTPSGKAVRTWEQYCEYLAAKDEKRIQVTTLPFPGRNVVLYSLGSSSKVGS